MGQSSTVKSAERTLEVLSFLSSAPSPVPATVIARSVGAPKSSTYHLLNVMLDRGFVTHFRDDGRWGIGAKARELGLGLRKDDSLQRMARPLMRRLAVLARTPVVLTVLHGADALVIERVAPRGDVFRGSPSVGERLPVHLSAFGRALLMDEPESRIRSLLDVSVELARVTPRGPRRHLDLMSILHDVRDRGYATDDGEVGVGIAAVAAPVFDHLGFVASAIGATYWAGSSDAERVDELACAVRPVADELSRRLGFRGRAT